MNGRLLLGAGLLATALELTVAWGLPAAMPGHSLVHDYISTAGATGAPHPAWFSALGIAAAALHLVFVAGLWRADDAPMHRIATGFFAAFFVLLGIGLAFRCDPGCALETTEAWTHFWFGLAAFLCLGVAAILAAVTAWCDGDGKGRLLVAASGVVVVLDLLLLLSDQTGFLRGLTERLTLAAMASWGFVWAFRLRVPATAANLAMPRR